MKKENAKRNNKRTDSYNGIFRDTVCADNFRRVKDAVRKRVFKVQKADSKKEQAFFDKQLFTPLL